MAFMRKGWRKIRVQAQDYFWRTRGHSWGVDLTIVTDAAFVSGQTGQAIGLTLDYGHIRQRMEEGVVALHQQAAITPVVVRLAIEWGLAQEPPFTGEPGEESLQVDGEALRQIQEQANRFRTEHGIPVGPDSDG